MLNNVPVFTSIFKDELKELIIFKRSMGYKYSDRYIRNFVILDNFFNSMNLTKKEITEDIYNKWCQQKGNESINNFAYRYYKLKVFVDYLKQNNYNNIYFKELNIKQRVQISIHIFTKNEFEEILYLIDHYDYKSLNEKQSIPIIFRMLYSCGFRISEVLDLKMSDIDSVNGTITVSKGKNYVTRCIPISDSLLYILKDYLNNKSFRLDDYLFVNNANSKFTYYNVYKVFKSSIDKYNKINNKTIKTRLHDLRHSFITNSYKKLIDLNYETYNALLLISKYVGHKGIKEVEYYIKAVNLKDNIFSTSYTKDLFGDKNE